MVPSVLLERQKMNRHLADDHSVKLGDEERIVGTPKDEQARSFFESQSSQGWEVHNEGQGINSIVKQLKK